MATGAAASSLAEQTRRAAAANKTLLGTRKRGKCNDGGHADRDVLPPLYCRSSTGLAVSGFAVQPALQQRAVVDHSICLQVPIQECDVCLISWEQLMKELREHHASSILAKFGFWRIIIDEAQVLQINYGEDGDMLNDLWRRKAWLLSGSDAARFTSVNCNGSHLCSC